ncbi:helix-turn-helix domain-containing protein [Streptomyces sp. HSW2009]|uniref:TetR/AcrR family transcriptional regulator n=1 Tax=Streptomyces sp. HSW2009 TaxID=3142890 RepID=UPI0032F0221B
MSIMRDRPVPAERLLDAASSLFAREGIRAVGIERILAEADVARASLYQHYGSKDALIVAYLQRQDELDRVGYERAAKALTDSREDLRARVLLVFDLAAKGARRRRFRGCLYLNAATEFPHASHPVNAAVRDHRCRIESLWTDALAGLGLAEPESTVAQLSLLYDGGLAGSKVSKSTAPILLAREMAAGLLPDG